MLGRLVGFSLRNRFVVLVLAAVLFGAGIYVASHSPMDVFPEFAPPQVMVETEAPGLSAEEVESLVTLRLELAIGGTPGIKTLRSTSMPGVSSITAIFLDATDVYRARQLVAERIATRTFADWTLTPRILAVPGISKIVTYGGRVAQDQVIVHPNALRDYGLALADIENAARGATAIGPTGTIESNGQRLPIRSMAQAQTPTDLANSVVAFRDSTPLLLSQVAEVRIGPEFPIGDATLDGAPAVVMLIARQPGVNTLQVTAELDSALEAASRTLPAGLVLHRSLFRQASFIERAISNLRIALWIGAGLVTVVLLLFLLDFRTALISLIAIPLSILTALVVLRLFGASVNIMTLGGLAIALGEVVDDSIIDVENVHRRLQLERALPDRRSRNDVIFDASLEVRSAVVYATFSVALVFVPVFFLSGVAGKIFSPLGAAYVLSTLASLGVALLVTPAACSLPRPRLSVLVAGALILLAAGGALLIAGEFLPSFQEHDFIVHMDGLPGTSLSNSVAAGTSVEQRLRKIPGIVSVAQRAGRAELADEVAGPESSEIDVRLSSDVRDVGAKVGEIRASLANFPGFSFFVSQFLTERIEEVAGGEAAPIAVSVFGTDLARLHQLGVAVGDLMGSIPGARDVRVEPLTKVPQIVISFDRARAAQLGAKMSDLQDAVTAAFDGIRVAEIFEGQRVVPVVVKLPDSSRADLSGIRDLPIRVASGVVPLESLARVNVQDLPKQITRQK